MKKTLLSVALLALLSLTAQANEAEQQMEATAPQAMGDAVQASSEAQTEEATAPDAENNSTQEEGEEKAPAASAE